jgi:hypothetical protein
MIRRFIANHDFEVMSGRRYIRTGFLVDHRARTAVLHSNPREASDSVRSTMRGRRRGSRYLPAIRLSS